MRDFFLIILNFVSWFKKSLFNILFISVHPIIFILALISFVSKFKTYFRKPLYRFVIIYSFIIIIICSIKLIKQGFLSDRYFLILTAVFCILAAEGFLITAEFISNRFFLENYYKISYRKLSIVLLVIILIIMALKPFIGFNKIWFNELRLISSNSNFIERPVLITNDSDQRYAYYLGSTLYLVNLDRLTISEDSLCEQWNHSFEIPQYRFSSRTEDFYKELHKLDKEVFLLIKGESPEDIEKLFKSQRLKFNFVVVKIFKDRKGEPISLFKLK